MVELQQCILCRRNSRRSSILPTSVRAALYEAAETWAEALKGRPFLGGSNLNLADLSVYGVLRTIEHLKSGKDMIQNMSIGEWTMCSSANLPHLLWKWWLSPNDFFKMTVAVDNDDEDRQPPRDNKVLPEVEIDQCKDLIVCLVEWLKLPCDVRDPATIPSGNIPSL
ncbi:hypothetical protein L3X38_000528 [Prunus dulcis]|uniref:Glutathione S-transferase C-terminal domain-containing protein n=1 Tax=Prunus dulcis TaxID=3755 RepID=A0AAD4WSP0_PRUDU|nr:hypothetical protein L3X38_000528 [Prunus dulcis]